MTNKSDSRRDMRLVFLSASTILTLLRGLILVVPLLPVAIWDSALFPFVAGKAFMFRLLVEVMFPLWVLVLLIDPGRRPRVNTITASLFVFSLLLFVADLYGVDPVQSFFGSLERMDGFVTWIHVVIFFLVLVTCLDHREWWIRFLSISLGVAVLCSVIALLQWRNLLPEMTYGGRVDATFGNAAYLSTYLMFHVFIAALLFAWSDRIRSRVILIALVGLFVFVMVLTGTRGGLLGLCVGAVTSAIIVLAQRTKSRRRMALVSGVAVVALVATLLVAKSSDSFHDSFALRHLTDFSVSERTANTRFLLWRIAGQGIAERPVLGWGQDNFRYVFQKYYDPRLFDREPWFDRAHNGYLGVAIAGGLAGLLAYLMFVFAILRAIWHTRREVDSTAILAGLMVAWLVQNIVRFDDLISQILFFSVAALVVRLTGNQERILNSAPIPAHSGIDKRIVVLVTLVVSMSAFYFTVYRPAQASVLTRQAVNAVEQDAEEGARLFHSALAAGGAVSDVRYRLALAALGLYERKSASPGAGMLVQLALDEQKKQVADSISAADWYVYGLLLRYHRNFSAAAVALGKAGSLAPGKQSILMVRGLNQLRLGDREQALQFLKEAYELEPRNTEVRDIYTRARTGIRAHSLRRD